MVLTGSAAPFPSQNSVTQALGQMLPGGSGLCGGEADPMVLFRDEDEGELSTMSRSQSEANTMNGPAVESFIFGRV
jgi:hypothetical protein